MKTSDAPRIAGRSRWSLRAALALAALPACSSGASSGLAGTDAGDPSADAGGESPLDAAAGACTAGCTGKAPAGSMCVVEIDGQLVDATGAPVVGEALFVCGTNLCSLPVKTDAQGNARFSVCANMVAPAFKYLGGTRYVSFAAAVTKPTQTFPPVTIVPLPSEGVAFPAGEGQVSSGPVTLQVAAGAVTFDPSAGAAPSVQEFRAAAMDLAKAPPGLDPSFGAKGLWGLSPLNATLAPAGTLTVPNPDTSDWKPGTKVDFFMNGLDGFPNPPVPYGGWGPVGTGTVSADGQSITTDTGPGNGVPIVGIIGVGRHS